MMPSQIGLMSIRSSTGAMIGTTTKVISMKSRKKPSANMISMTTNIAPTTPPGMSESASCTMSSPPRPRKTNEKRAAPMRMTKTMALICMVERMTGTRTPTRQTRQRLVPMP